MMRSETELSEFSVAPLLGAAGAAVAFSVAAERFAIKRQTAALGCAAVAFGLSQATSGAARALFQGAALAGIGLAIVELVRTLRQDRPAATPSGVTQQPADAITRSELQAAFAAAQPQHVAAADGEQPKQVDDSVHALAIELVRGVRTNESPHAAPVVAVRGANIPAVDAGASISAKAVEHLLRVYGLLEERERRTVSAINATRSIEEVAAQRVELLRRSPSDAVAYLRRFVLGTNRAAMAAENGRAAGRRIA